MFDLSQLVKIELIILGLCVLFLGVSIKFNYLGLGLIVIVESLLTTFMSRHYSLSYWLYDGLQYEQAWVLYITSTIAIQCLVLSISSYFFKNPFIAFAYLLNIMINICSFGVASLVSLYPESGSALAIQASIDNFYWYVFWLSIALILVGLSKGNSGGHRKSNNIERVGDNQLSIYGQPDYQRIKHNQRFY